MHRFFLHLAYDGSKYRGWQWQPNVISVQATIEDVLKRIFKEKITVYGCGRTDAEVHASQYIAHINLPYKPEYDLIFRLNKNLPDNIVIHEMQEVNDNQHARFDAVSRTYDYFIHTELDPFLHRYSSYYPYKDLDVVSMQSAAKLFIKYTDYRSLCKQADSHNHTLCEIKHAAIYANSEANRIRFSITSNRFLREMIRLSVAYLLKVGTGELTVEGFEDLLANPRDIDNKKSALPHGLYLSKVEYPFISFEQKQDISQILKLGLD